MPDRGVIATFDIGEQYVLARATGGNLSISGTVTTKDGVPRGVIAELYSYYDSAVVDSTACDASGAYLFTGMREGKYEVRFLHPTRKFRSRVVHAGVNEMRIQNPHLAFFALGMFDATGFRGVAGAVYTVVGGRLAAGHALQPNGNITGAPTEGGHFRVLVKATTENSVQFSQWIYMVGAYLVNTSSSGESGRTSRTFALGSLSDPASWEEPHEADARINNSWQLVCRVSRDEYFYFSNSNTWTYSKDGARSFQNQVGNTLTSAAGSSFFAKSPTTGTFFRSRGSVSGSPPNVVVRYPQSSLFLETASTSGAGGSANYLTTLPSGRVLTTQNSPRLQRSDDDGVNYASTSGDVAVSGSGVDAVFLSAGGQVVIAGVTTAVAPSGIRNIRRSTDNGETWVTAHTFTGTFVSGESASQLAGNPATGKWVCICSGGTKAAWSNDNGVSWTQIVLPSAMPSVSPMMGLTYNHTLDQFAYLGTGNTIYFSNDGGATWTLGTLPFTGTVFNSIVSTSWPGG